MTFPADLAHIRIWKERVLDTKSPSFCGAKWYFSSIWLWRGWTASCHHNPPHQIDKADVMTVPSALHNTQKKINERGMMQRGEKPLDCQYCWIVESAGSDVLPDRIWYSKGLGENQLQTAFDNKPNQHVNPTYLELGFDSTCNLACSYCCPDISTSWMKDIKQNGPYHNIQTDERQHYTTLGSGGDNFTYGEANPYVDAFFKYWETDLHKSLSKIHITGGEPVMSGHFWRFLDWLESNTAKSQALISIQTNLAYNAETLEKLLDKISKIKKTRFSICTSNESTANQTEYVRDGLQWQQWCANIDTLIASKLVKRIEIFSTISAVSLYGFVDFLQWLVDKKQQTNKFYFDLYVSYVRWPTFQSVVILPYEIRKYHSEQIQSFVEQNKQWFSDQEQNFLTRLSTYLIEISAPHKGSIISNGTLDFDQQTYDHSLIAMQKDFKSFFTQYDQRRNKNFSMTFPSLAEWYDSIQV